MVEDGNMAGRPNHVDRSLSDERLQIPTIHSGRWILGAVTVLVGLSIYTWLSSTGADIRIRTNARGALVQIDSKGSFTNADVASFQRLPFGQRQIQLSHIDYEPVSISFHNGWFSSRDLTLNMNPRPVRLVVQTVPGAEVLYDSASLGHADANGRFQSLQIAPGSHQILVRQSGFLDWSQQLEIHPPEARIAAFLAINPERQRQIEQSRQQVNGLLRTAQQQFLNRQFSNALAAVTDALKLDPNNSEAVTLRDRIDQTMKILK